jgi:hypothetical protein
MQQPLPNQSPDPAQAPVPVQQFPHNYNQQHGPQPMQQPFPNQFPDPTQFPAPTQLDSHNLNQQQHPQAMQQQQHQQQGNQLTSSLAQAVAAPASHQHQQQLALQQPSFASSNRFSMLDFDDFSHAASHLSLDTNMNYESTNHKRLRDSPSRYTNALPSPSAIALQINELADENDILELLSSRPDIPSPIIQLFSRYPSDELVTAVLTFQNEHLARAAMETILLCPYEDCIFTGDITPAAPFQSAPTPLIQALCPNTSRPDLLQHPIPSCAITGCRHTNRSPKPPLHPKMKSSSTTFDSIPISSMQQPSQIMQTSAPSLIGTSAPNAISI